MATAAVRVQIVRRGGTVLVGNGQDLKRGGRVGHLNVVGGVSDRRGGVTS